MKSRIHHPLYDPDQYITCIATIYFKTGEKPVDIKFPVYDNLMKWTQELHEYFIRDHVADVAGVGYLSIPFESDGLAGVHLRQIPWSSIDHIGYREKEDA